MEKNTRTHIATICRLEKVITPSCDELEILIPIEIAEGTIDRCKNFVDHDGTKFSSVSDAWKKEEKFGYLLDVSYNEMLDHGLNVMTRYLSFKNSNKELKGCDNIVQAYREHYELELKKVVWFFDLAELTPILTYSENDEFYERYGVSLDRELGVLDFGEPECEDIEGEGACTYDDSVRETVESTGVEIAEGVFKEPKEKPASEKLGLNITRKKLIEETKKRVIAQELAVERVCSAVYDPMCLGINNLKQNILLYGPSGVGKTYLVRTIAKLLGLPFSYVNLSKLSASGFEGGSVNDIYRGLYVSANCDIKKLELGGIVFLDEVDKLKGAGDIKEAVYNELLDLLEPGGVTQFKFGKYGESVSYCKDNLQVFSAGTFAKMLKLQDRACGFGVENKKIDVVSRTYNFTSEDFINNGYSPEFMGRQHLCVPLNGLTEEDYYRILTESIDSAYVRVKEGLASKRNIDLQIAEEALKYIAKVAYGLKKGGRGLTGVFNDVIQPEIDSIVDEIDEGNIITGGYEVPYEQVVKRLERYHKINKEA